MSSKIPIIKIALVCESNDEVTGFQQAVLATDYDNTLQAISESDAIRTLGSRKIPPSIIFICMGSDDMHQLSILDKIRSRSEYDRSTLVIISKSTDPAIVNRSLSSGGNVFLSRPTTKQALAEVLIKVFKSHICYAEHGFDRSAFYLKL